MSTFLSDRLSAYYMNSDPNNSQMHFDVDVTGEDYVHTIKYGTGLYSFNHMQTIGKNLVLGYEFMTLVSPEAIVDREEPHDDELRLQVRLR